MKIKYEGGGKPTGPSFEAKYTGGKKSLSGLRPIPPDLNHYEGGGKPTGPSFEAEYTGGKKSLSGLRPIPPDLNHPPQGAHGMKLNKKYESGGLNKGYLNYAENGATLDDGVGDNMDAKTDQLELSEAFNLFREKLGPGQMFMWRGEKHATDTEEEINDKASTPKMLDGDAGMEEMLVKLLMELSSNQMDLNPQNTATDSISGEFTIEDLRE